MIELITKNVIIGVTIIVLNSVPLILKKYGLIPLTVTISLLLAIFGNYVLP